MSHTYVVAINQQKIEELAKYKDLHLMLIVPKHWRDPLRDIHLEKCEDPIYKILPMNIYFNGHYYSYFYDPLPTIWFIKKVKPDIIYVDSEPFGLSAYQFALLSRLVKSKFVFFSWENIYKRYKYPKSFFEKYVLQNAHYAIAGNTEAKDNLIKKGFHNPILVSPQLGIDPLRFCPKSQTGLKKQLGLRGFTIGYIGRLVKEKGMLTLVTAVSGLSCSFSLLIVGKGPMKDTFVRYARRKGILGRVVLIESVPHSEIPDYMNCLDTLVLPSVTTEGWKEQFGHVIIEAMSCGVPVIGSNSGSIPEVIGDAGLIFQEGDYIDLRDKITHLIDSKALREELKEKGLRRIKKEFTNEKIANNILDIFHSLMGKEVENII